MRTYFLYNILAGILAIFGVENTMVFIVTGMILCSISNHSALSPKASTIIILKTLKINTSLKQTEYTKEYEHIPILNVAVSNGLDKKLVDKMITTFKRWKHIKEITTLST